MNDAISPLYTSSLTLIPDLEVSSLSHNSTHTPFCLFQNVSISSLNLYVPPATEHPEKNPSYHMGYDSIDVLQHILSYGGFEGTPLGAKIIKPQNIPLASSNRHFFSCWDSRSDYNILGTPGGDMAEFILVLAALENNMPLSQRLSPEQMISYFEAYLLSLPKFHRDYFYMHTDMQSLSHWSRISNVSNPLHPTNSDEKKRLIDSFYAGLGCQVLHNLLYKANEYQVRPLLVSTLIQHFYSIYLDESHPLKHFLYLYISEGYTGEERAIVNIVTSSRPSCRYRHPLTQPSIDNQHQIIIYNPQAVYEYRASLASFVSDMEHLKQQELVQLFTDMNNIATSHLKLHKKYLLANNMPSYLLTFN